MLKRSCSVYDRNLSFWLIISVKDEIKSKKGELLYDRFGHVSTVMIARIKYIKMTHYYLFLPNVLIIVRRGKILLMFFTLFLSFKSLLQLLEYVLNLSRLTSIDFSGVSFNYVIIEKYI